MWEIGKECGSDHYNCSVSYKFKEVYQHCFHLNIKKKLMENVDRTQNVNSRNKNNESTNIKIVRKKYNFNISETVGFIVWIVYYHMTTKNIKT